jgi:hypothetical protein
VFLHVFGVDRQGDCFPVMSSSDVNEVRVFIGLVAESRFGDTRRTLPRQAAPYNV